ncbi:MAG: carbohydrate kinase family protein [Planctomycetota bacterium]|jgi:fructokinase
MKTILAFGETLWDVFPAGAKLGGAPLNFVYRADSLGDHGVIATRIGTDELGDRALAEIEQLGLDTSHVQRDAARPTGTVPVTVDEAGNPDFTILPDVAYDYIEATEAMLAAAAGADCVCFGTLVQRAPVSRESLGKVLGAAKGAIKLLDINLRRDCYTDETVAASLERADVLKLNDDEARELAGMFGMGEPSIAEFAPRACERWSLSHCVVTLGERGALGASRGGEAAYAPGYRVEVADTCGSGDAFTAGFIHRLLEGRPLTECCELGCALGAMVASQDGGTAAVSPEEVEAFTASGAERIGDDALKA